MNKVLSSAVVVAGLVFTLGGAASWGAGPPPNPTDSDNLGNTAGGRSALANNTTGSSNTAFGFQVLSNNTASCCNSAFGF